MSALLKAQHRRAGIALASVLAILDIPASGAPLITEFMASNSETLSVGGATPDWIEIHNAGADELDLAGWHLTDDAGDLNKWTFPDSAAIAGGGYLLVYASGLGAAQPGGEYHTNFRLEDAGEYFALVRPDGAVEQEFAPGSPEQFTDGSYGLPAGGGPNGYFQTPTPGEANNEAVLGFVKDTTFSHKRGFYEAPFELEVTTATPGATLYYTTDGSTPDAGSARVDAPGPDAPPVLSLAVGATALVRVFAAKEGFEPTNIDTQTYLFLEDVIASPSMSAAITGHAEWGPQMGDALLEIPSISLVTQQDIPTQPIMSPPEIPCSIEMIFPDGRDGFQLDAGVERFGGQYTLYPKHAMRISFKAIYGRKRLDFDLFGDTPYGGETAADSFDQILLRNGSHDCIFDHHYSHSRAIYVRNRYFFDRQLEAGHLSMRGRFVHVYHNGDYVGHYHLMERPNADFMATYLGGEEGDYDIMKGRSGIFVSQGERAAWDHLVSNANSYGVVRDYMDIDNYIDYMLLNFYGGNDHDWYPQHNWVAGRRREAGGKFQFFMWDNDFHIRRGGNATTGSTADTTDNGGPGGMLNALKHHEEFRVRMADRAQKHFFNGGMLTPERVKADFTHLAESVSRTIIPETARWAAAAQSYHSSNGFYTPESFREYVDWVVDVNADTRSGVVVEQMRSAGLFPAVDAPSFSQHGGRVPAGFRLQLSNDAGDVYYTTDGSDPRLPGGGINPEAGLIAGGVTGFTAVPRGATWRYADGGDLGTAWREVGYDDSAWPSGPAPLGFGGITGTSIATPVNETLPRQLTFYCRRDFEIAGASAVLGAALEIHADDGVVVYINGTEVARDRMPDGAVSFSTPASSNGNEGTFDRFDIDHRILVEGTNTIAAEVHNRTAGSGDMVIDLALVGTRLDAENPTVPIDRTMTVRARSLSAGEWSALNEATFLANAAAGPGNLVISEIHYHPDDQQGELAEYVELMNISGAPIDLGGVAFTGGIAFTFSDENVLGAGERVVLVADPAVFEAVFGPGVALAGAYSSRLANGGERLTLSASDGSPIRTVRYDDRPPWPTEPDGGGYSLVLISPESDPDHELPQNWRASVEPGGSPGAGDSFPFTGDPATGLLSYAFGDGGAPAARISGGELVVELPRVLGADDVRTGIEVSDDLVRWEAVAATLLEQSVRTGDGGAVVMRWAVPASGAGAVRYARGSVRLVE